MLKQAEWVKLVFNETPEKANVKQGYLYDEGDFFRIVGDTTETLVRKSTVVAITKKKSTHSPSPIYHKKYTPRVMSR